MFILPPNPTPPVRNSKGHFLPGQSGNANGRPAGSRTHFNKILDSQAQDVMEELFPKLVDFARNGDMQAMKILVDRAWPAPKVSRDRLSSKVDIDLTNLSTQRESMATVVRAIADQSISVEEGERLLRMLDVVIQAEISKQIECLLQRVEALRKRFASGEAPTVEIPPEHQLQWGADYVRRQKLLAEAERPEHDD